MLYNLFQKVEQEATIPNLIYEALTWRPGKNWGKEEEEVTFKSIELTSVPADKTHSACGCPSFPMWFIEKDNSISIAFS